MTIPISPMVRPQDRWGWCRRKKYILDGPSPMHECLFPPTLGHFSPSGMMRMWSAKREEKDSAWTRSDDPLARWQAVRKKEEAEEDWEDDEREKQHQHQHQHRYRHLGNYEGEAEYSADVSDVLRCDREGCGLTFLDFDRWQEHLDEHVAKELQADERRKEQQQIKKPPSPRGGQKITEFFSTQK